MSDSTLREIAQRHGASKEDYYLSLYEKRFSHMRDEVRAVLELGVQGGGSLKMWSEFFPNAVVVGVDIADCSASISGDKVLFFQGRQEDPSVFRNIRHKTGIACFDIIIDDASHFGLYSKKSYDILFDDYLKPGGKYIIEDWGTGYWDDWPDGSRYEVVASEVEDLSSKERSVIYQEGETSGLLPKTFHSHQFGMVGFVKQLIDEAHRGAIRNATPYRLSKFNGMQIAEGVVIIDKK